MAAPQQKPGDGIKSLRTSSAFRIINFELYATPNKAIMILGTAAILGCAGYIMYMRKKYEGMGYYAAVDREGGEVFVKRESKWD